MKRLYYYTLLLAAFAFCILLASCMSAEYTFETLAGNPVRGYEDGKGCEARFTRPQGIAVGELYSLS